MRRTLLAGVGLVGCLLALPASAQESPLQAAVRLTGEGRYSAALEAARGGEDPLARAQGELYALHRAGALEEALGAGLRGLAVAPRDPWTLEQTAYVALSLGAGELAARLVARLERELDAAGLERVGWMREEAERLAAQRRAEAGALERARLTGLAGVLLTLVAAATWLRPPRPAA